MSDNKKYNDDLYKYCLSLQNDPPDKRAEELIKYILKKEYKRKKSDVKISNILNNNDIIRYEYKDESREGLYRSSNDNIISRNNDRKEFKSLNSFARYYQSKLNLNNKTNSINAWIHCECKRGEEWILLNKLREDFIS